MKLLFAMTRDAIEFKALKNTVSKLLENTEINLNITKNSKNLGGFKNKYSCIEKVSNDFVYQIDSDNIANPKSLKVCQILISNFRHSDTLFTFKNISF